MNAPAPAALAKAALRRLAQERLEPTPENYAQAYASEGGQSAAAATADPEQTGAVWVALLERLAKNLPRGGRQWTVARRKDSLQRVLDGSRSDAQRLQQRLSALMLAWETDQAGDPAATGIDDPPLNISVSPVTGDWPPLAQALQSTVQAALAGAVAAPADAAELARQLSELAQALNSDGATAQHVKAITDLCEQAKPLLGQGHRLLLQLSQLCRELTTGLTELCEDDAWTQGQCRQLQEVLGSEMSLRGLRSAAALLGETRQHHRHVQGQRRAARDEIKQLIGHMLAEVAALGQHTGRFEAATLRHAQTIAAADSLPDLAQAVKSLLHDTRQVQSAVALSQQSLLADQARAGELQARVLELEAELRRLSDEVCTDQLTQVANRRGLAQAFDAECARSQSNGNTPLGVGLIDIDNFKKLNDSLGHAAGDVALQNLASAVRQRLRPVDHVARFGGEEFVVLMPGTGLEMSVQALSRLQRSLSEALFLHEGREVFVTFSAGVTAWRSGESLQQALERADQALYDAKRGGKNRTCSL